MAILRSILAIFAGAVVVVVLSEGSDWLAGKAGMSFTGPDATLSFLIATVYRCVYAVLGCYIAARLAPSAPMPHAMILGGIGFAANIAGLIAMWSFGAHWYPIALTVTALPCAWLGGRLAAGNA